MWMLATVRIGFVWYYIDDEYIRHGATQADEFQEENVDSGLSLRLEIVNTVSGQINILLAEGIMVSSLMMLIVNLTIL